MLIKRNHTKRRTGLDRAFNLGNLAVADKIGNCTIINQDFASGDTAAALPRQKPLRNDGG